MPSRARAKKPTPKLSYAAMITEAITELASTRGCSQVALEKYITASYRKLDYRRHFLRAAINRGLETGAFLRHHNHRNSIKLPPKKPKAAAPKKTASQKKKAAPKKRTTKKTASKKKKAAPKKRTTKKTASKKKKAAPKKRATKKTASKTKAAPKRSRRSRR